MMITSTILGFKVIMIHCDEALQCNSLELVDQPMFEVTNHANAMDHCIPIRSAARTIGFEQLLRQTVCVVHFHKSPTRIAEHACEKQVIVKVSVSFSLRMRAKSTLLYAEIS